MMRPINRNISKITRTVHRLSELIDELHESRVNVSVEQVTRYTDNGNTWKPSGFKVTINGRSYAAPPEAP